MINIQVAIIMIGFFFIISPLWVDVILGLLDRIVDLKIQKKQLENDFNQIGIDIKENK